MQANDEHPEEEIRIAMDRRGLVLPYHAVKREDGENFGYFDLVAHPELVAQIPEISQLPACQDFLRAINGPKSSFRTIRTVTGAERMEFSGAAPFWQALCVLGITSRVPGRIAGVPECYGIIGMIHSHLLKRRLIFPWPPLFQIQGVLWQKEQVEGFVFDIHMTGTGPTEQAAWEHFQSFLPPLTEIMLSLQSQDN